MDQTKCFQQIVHTIGNHSNSVVCNGLRNEDKSRQISWKLRELVASITCMKDYLLANQKDYVNIYNSILYLSSKMTDEERDQIDKDVHDFVKLGNDVIKILRVELKSTTSKQQFEHEMNAINLVEMYLQSINDLHNKNKALRLRRNLYMQKFFRLNKSNVNNNNNNNNKTDGIDGLSTSTENQAANKTTIKLRKNLKSSETNNNSLKSSENLNSKTSFYNDYHNEQLLSSNNESMNNCRLAPEEQKQFQLESKQIYDQMNSMNEEVITITKKLAEISKLQELFSENVIKQECDLNNLNLSTITSNESIREGNEQLREAMRKNAGFRVWILFFITTLAFVVLFLDWYNP